MLSNLDPRWTHFSGMTTRGAYAIGSAGRCAFALCAALGLAAPAHADEQPGASQPNPAPFSQVNPGGMNQDELIACANTQLDVEARMAEVELRRQALEVRQVKLEEDANQLDQDMVRFNADRKRKKEQLAELQRRAANQKAAGAGINREIDALSRYVKQANELNRAQRQNCAFRSFRLDDAARLTPQQRAVMGVEDIAQLQQERRPWDAAADCANFEKDYSAEVVNSFNALGSRARLSGNGTCTVSLTVMVDPAGKILSAEIHPSPSDCQDEVLAFAQRRISVLQCSNPSGKQRVESVDMQIQDASRLPIFR
jgi:hypothetical protein